MNTTVAWKDFPPGWRREVKVLTGFVAAFLLLFHLPIGVPRFAPSIREGLELTRWYAREHVVLCLIPALFIAGAISAFIQQASVMRYLGPKAHKVRAYGVASVSGTILAVCSCTVLPLFGGIWKRGAGLGPATAFLYSGPAINVLALVLTARILGLELGLARAIGAIAFSLLIGLAMQAIFRREEQARTDAAMEMPEPDASRPLWQTSVFFASMVGVLVFANWSSSAETTGFWAKIHAWKWPISAAFALLLGWSLGRWFGFSWRGLALTTALVALTATLFPSHPLVAFLIGCAGLVLLCTRHPGEGRDWLASTWTLSKQIFPLLIAGVFVSGMLLGRPGHEALIPADWISSSVGGNSLLANLCASVVGAFMYFATLTEVPILQGLLGSGMGHGPALALLLAGPSLSLPSMLVLRSILGTRRLLVYVALVVTMATVTGWLYGTFFP
jgi:uncharacterized membrane protein YraQ (UPF0718 family)